MISVKSFSSNSPVIRNMCKFRNCASCLILEKGRFYHTLARNTEIEGQFFRSTSTATASSPSEETAIVPEANAVILGGGAVGTSVAYHLAQGGYPKVVLLERKTLAAGSTLHTPGLISYFHWVPRFKRILSYTVDLYSKLERETGQEVRFHRNGTLRLAKTPQRIEEFRKYLSRVESRSNFLKPDEVGKICPVVDTSKILGALHTEGDGFVDTVDIARALAAGARRAGALIYENCSDTKTTWMPDEGMWEIQTNRGNIRTKHIICTTGLWARDACKPLGMDLRLILVEHQYAVTKGIASVKSLKLPVIHDPDDRYYVRQIDDHLLFGAFEDENGVSVRKDWTLHGVPKDVERDKLEPHFQSIKKNFEAASEIIPLLRETAFERKHVGILCMTPDAVPLLGPVQGVPNYWLATGLFDGIASAGGVGKYLADWLIEGEPPFELLETEPSRFDSWAGRKYRITKAKESYAMFYGSFEPPAFRPAGRPTVRVSGIYGALVQGGAKFLFNGGFEQPLWFSSNGPDRATAVANEYKAVTSNAGIVDLTWYSKIEIRGPDSHQFLDMVLCNDAPELGTLCRSYMISPKGKVMSQVKVACHDARQNVYLLVSSPELESRNLRWLQTVARENKFNVEINNVTEYLACIGVGGPKCRELLAQLTKEDVTDEKYVYGTVKLIRVANVPVVASRVSDSGELSWQLYHNRAESLKIYEALRRVGNKMGAVDFGWDAFNVMRLEKGIKLYGYDISLDTDPFEAGVDGYIDFNKKADFIGKSAVLELKKKERARKLVLLVLDENVPMTYRFRLENVRRGNEIVGFITSGCFSYVLQKPLVYAYVSNNATESDQLTVDILGRLVRAKMLEKPPLQAYHRRTDEKK